MFIIIVKIIINDAIIWIIKYIKIIFLFFIWIWINEINKKLLISKKNHKIIKSEINNERNENSNKFKTIKYLKNIL